MRKLPILAAVALALALAPQALAETITVDIHKNSFSPTRVTVAPGDTVVWKNTDTAQHQVVANDSSFKSPVLAPGQTFSQRFTGVKTIAYHGGLHPELKGTLNVATATMSLTRRIVRYGAAVTLSGNVSGATAGEAVTVRVKPFDRPERLLKVTTDANGDWTLRVVPLIQTRYSASLGSVTTQGKIVFVRPRVVLRRLSHTRFKVTVLTLNPLATSFVRIERWSRKQHHYTTFARVHLRASNADGVWTRTFRLRVRRGTRLRAIISAGQAGPGYLYGQSNQRTA